jgi:carnitine-CoA ligase
MDESSFSLSDLRPLEERTLGRSLLENAAATPQATALMFLAENQSWTYGELHRDSLQIASALVGLGLEPGDRLGIMLPNRSEFALSWLGATLAGLIDVAINWQLKSNLLAHQLRIAGVRGVVCDAVGYAAIADLADQVPTLEFVIPVEPVPGRAGLRAHPFTALASESTIEPRISSPTSIQSIRYTSGTTGPAKAVAMINSQLVIFAQHFCWMMSYKSSDRLYTAFPMYHGMATYGLVSTLQAGGSYAVDRKFSASRFWEQVHRSEATLSHLLAPVVPMLMNQPDRPTDRSHRCRAMFASFPNEAFEERFGVQIANMYGMSEGNMTTMVRPGMENPPGSTGFVTSLFDVRVVDDNEVQVPNGVVGEILWRPKESHMIMAGYYGNPEATIALWRGLWAHSGDEGWLDDDNRLYLIGRMGDQIRSKGVNIAASDIEDVTRKFPGVIDVAAIAVPSDLADSDVKVAVEIAHGQQPTKAEFIRFLAEELPRGMRPRYVEFRSDLPRTDTYKVLKNKLRTEGDRGITAATIDLQAPEGDRTGV